MRYLAAEAGIRQFLDIGTGIPAQDNTHEVAQRVAPESRVVYVDNDPIVLAHARALLTSSPRGRHRTTSTPTCATRDTILAASGRHTLDFSQPVAVMLLAILHLIPDEEDPYADRGRLHGRGAVRQLPGHLTRSSDIQAETQAAGQRYNSHSATAITFRSRQEVTRFFAGLHLRPAAGSPRWASGHSAPPEPVRPSSPPTPPSAANPDTWSRTPRVNCNHAETPAGHTH